MTHTNSSLDAEVDQLAEGLKRCQPRLDDVARARVAAQLATISQTEQVPKPQRSYQRHIVAGMIAACGVVVALYWPTSTHHNASESVLPPISIELPDLIRRP